MFGKETVIPSVLALHYTAAVGKFRCGTGKTGMAFESSVHPALQCCSTINTSRFFTNSANFNLVVWPPGGRKGETKHIALWGCTTDHNLMQGSAIFAKGEKCVSKYNFNLNIGVLQCFPGQHTMFYRLQKTFLFATDHYKNHTIITELCFSIKMKTIM